jgi:hypothetical protein
VTEDGACCCVALAEAQALPFEHFRPVRRFAARKGQRHLSGLWWSATTGGHVGFESWLERDYLMLLDFDPQVAGISSQPFWLRWRGEDGRPGFACAGFLRPPAGRLGCGSRLPACRAARAGRCREVRRDGAGVRPVGWEYRLAGAADEIVAANVRWLAGYRHPRHKRSEPAGVLRRVFAGPAPLLAGAEAAGDPIAVLPVLFHLLWRHDLVADLSVPLGSFTLVSARAAR